VVAHVVEGLRAELAREVVGVMGVWWVRGGEGWYQVIRGLTIEE
jgi:hypothetical protein